MAQRQRVGFQTRRLGVQIPLGSVPIFFSHRAHPLPASGASLFPGRSSRLAQLVERKTLNLVVVGSSPTVGAPARFLIFLLFCSRCP